jgi:hypothetical protein
MLRRWKDARPSHVRTTSLSFSLALDVQIFLRHSVHLDRAVNFQLSQAAGYVLLEEQMSTIRR